MAPADNSNCAKKQLHDIDAPTYFARSMDDMAASTDCSRFMDEMNALEKRVSNGPTAPHDQEQV